MKDINRLFTFLLDDRRYALPLDAVMRVIPAVALTPLPGAPAIVKGLIDVEGTIVPVVGIRARFRLPDREIDVEDRIIIARTVNRILGIPVDAAGEVIEMAEEEIDRGARILMGSEYIEGVLRLDEGLVLIHDPERFLSIEEEESLAGALAGKDDNR